jgi:AcrR family transcriptional regulator
MLLAAAEGILAEKGVNALSVRKVGDAAGLNPALVTYHFKSILNLLDELCTLNLDPILMDWRAIDPALGTASGELEEVLRAWLAPMLRPAAFTPRGRALIVIDEIASHGEPALRDRVLTAMEQFSIRLRATLAPILPHLSEHELRARLRFISGAVLGPPPRIHTVLPSDGARSLGDLAYLLPFARAALSR